MRYYIINGDSRHPPPSSTPPPILSSGLSVIGRGACLSELTWESSLFLMWLLYNVHLNWYECCDYLWALTAWSDTHACHTAVVCCCGLYPLAFQVKCLRKLFLIHKHWHTHTHTQSHTQHTFVTNTRLTITHRHSNTHRYCTAVVYQQISELKKRKSSAHLLSRWSA